MRAIAVLVLILASGCNHIQANYAGASTTSGGTVVSSSGGGLRVQGGPLGVLILGSVLIAGAVDGQPGRAMYADERPAPEMQPDRAISEQDCTKPIDLTAGNLRCK
jgi:hypothetical protein